MSLGETAVYCSLESVFFSGTISILCVPSAFGVRAGFDVNTSHSRWNHFYTGCVCSVPLVGELDLMWTQVTSFLSALATITLVDLGLETEQLELVVSVRWDFLSAQWLSPPSQGWGLS